jgi:hypothetical protein
MCSFCYVYLFLLLCMFPSRYSASLCCSVHCLCVLCTVLLPPGVNPIAVNKCIKSIQNINNRLAGPMAIRVALKGM